jgi:hypothetical protein
MVMEPIVTRSTLLKALAVEAFTKCLTRLARLPVFWTSVAAGFDIRSRPSLRGGPVPPTENNISVFAPEHRIIPVP